MSDPKEKAIEIRDRLNAIVDEVMTSGDQEAHIVACCLALAVEELEKYLYEDGWTPSVAPYKDGRKFEIPFKPGEDDSEAFAGPPWSRRRKSVFDKYPTLAKLRKTGIKAQPSKVDLTSRLPIDWSQWERRVFREGDRAAFVKAVRRETGCTLRQAHEYANEMKARNPSLWGVDNHPADSCPHCRGKNVKRVKNAQHPYWCQDCRTQWGHVWGN